MKRYASKLSLTDTRVSQSGQLVEVVFLTSVFKRSLDTLVKWVWLWGRGESSGRGNDWWSSGSLDGFTSGEDSLHVCLISFECELDFSFWLNLLLQESRLQDKEIRFWQGKLRDTFEIRLSSQICHLALRFYLRTSSNFSHLRLKNHTLSTQLSHNINS